jgi:hypothetical protein
MPRYYFNLVHHGGEPVPDDEGLDLEDDAVAKREALRSLRELVAESVNDDLKPLHISVEIVREGAGVIDRLTAQVAVPARE